ncbi:hypothetical protein [Helicobacter sp.]|uniref:hypothetical protein n=1 Tax=Helicobacter sp. TaxID=218 RepID=UPI0025C5BA40|nr:hypothetical protein [Helicobacter sp.]MCI5633825.1 hypothetical protein [Helicobacter sp.]
MKLYLISKNPIISKLVALSASKIGVEIVESQEINMGIDANIVLLDDECYEPESFNAYKEANQDAKTALFYAKSTERIEGFDTYIQKPFLPTDLVKTLSEISGIEIVASHTPKAEIQSDIVEPNEDNNLEDLNLDDEIDFSSLDDLNLDDETPQDGDMQLDFGADDEEGIESAENNNNTESTNNIEDMDAQLDFGADDALEEESQIENAQDTPQVLDKSDVDEIKDLLGDSTEGAESQEDTLDLDKELGALTDDLDSFDSKDSEGLDAIEEIDSTQEMENTNTQNTQDSTRQDPKEDDFEFSLDDLELDNDSNAQDSTLEPALEDSQSKEAESLEPANEDDIGNMEIDLSDFDLGEETEATNESAESLNSIEATEIPDTQETTNSLEIDTLGDNIIEDTPDSQVDEKPETLDSLDLSEDLGSLEDLELEKSKKNTEASTESDISAIANDDLSDFVDLKLDDVESLDNAESDTLSDSKDTDKTNVELDIASNDLDLESAQEEDSENNLESLEDTTAQDLDLTQDSASENAIPQAELQTKSNEMDDDFSALSIESMGEALGEPVSKDPIPAPIVTQDAPKATETQLPSNIQANSIESLIGTLQALQAQNLKDLLSGATISINIQFPKKD